MFKRYKKTIVFVLISLISINSVSYFTPKTESIDPMFFLEAKCYKTKHLDYLNLIKQQLARIGIHLIIEYVNLSEIGFLGGLIAFRDFDFEIIEFPCSAFDNPFNPELYSENGSLNLAVYHTSMDWDTELGTGRNEWYIQTGLQMTPNNSQERLNLCWDWQHYLMDDILPCLPLFAHKNDSSSLELLVFNLREVRPILGNRSPCVGYPAKSMGLGWRKAISYAINREEIKRVALGDDYEIIHHPINPTNKSWLNPNGVKYCHDLTATRDFMDTVGLGCWAPGPYIGYGRWPRWEDVCAKNLTTIKSPGFEVLCAVIVLIILSQVFLINRLKTLKEKKANDKGGI